MEKTIEFKAHNDKLISIVADKIVAFCSRDTDPTFSEIWTLNLSDEDGPFVIHEEYEDVKTKIRLALGQPLGSP